VPVDDQGNSGSVVTSLTSTPQFIDKTLISGVETVVVGFNQTVGTFTQRTFYASAIGSWTEITDADYTANALRGKMEHLDGFAFQLTSANKIVNSDLNSLSSWTATNYTTKQIQQDEPAGLAKFKNMILAFGNSSVEGFYNAGYATASPLESIKQIACGIGLGVAAPFNKGGVGTRHYYTTLGDKMYFVGRKFLRIALMRPMLASTPSTALISEGSARRA
jgi:hypothetical protein